MTGSGDMQFPEDRRGEAADADDGHPQMKGEPNQSSIWPRSSRNSRAAEPMAMSAMPTASIVDLPYRRADGFALSAKVAGSWTKRLVRKEREEADGDVDEEDPAPVVVVGDPAAEDGADGRRGDDGDV